MLQNFPPITLKDVEEAAHRISPYIRQTPILPFDYLNRRDGTQHLLKAEFLQKTGSFKIRGAANFILANLEKAKKSGVVAASAGNHAQGVAHIAASLGVSATIVMPISTPGIKVQNTESWGAKVELVGNVYDESYVHANQIAEKTGALFVHPFRDPFIQAGQGTLALEMLKQAEFQDVDAVVIAIGGGGLLTGVGTVLRTLKPGIKIFGVTARNAPAMYQALSQKQATEIPVTFTLAEGVATKRVEQFMVDRIAPVVDEVFDLSEESIAHAISVLAEQAKIVVEGAGALPAAALLDGIIPAKKAVALTCGGNIDLPALTHVLERGLVGQGRWVRLLITLWDRPGSLHVITKVLSESRANIIQIMHQRATLHTKVGEAEVEVDIETRSREHTNEIIANLEKNGLKVSKLL